MNEVKLDIDEQLLDAIEYIETDKSLPKPYGQENLL